MDGSSDHQIPLDQPRVIRLTIGKAPVSFTFKRIEPLAWRKFCEALVTRVEQRKGERISMLDEESALLTLFEQACEKVEGYGATNISRVPLKHRIAAAGVLRAIGTELPALDTLALSEFAEVRLTAPWSANLEGDMAMYTGLVHRFKQPSIDQYRRWRLGLARVAVSGTAQNGVTIYPSRLAVGLGLYDEMIAEVEGYTYNGKSLTGADPKEVAERMDGMHKARAVVELFDRDEEEVTLGGQAEDEADA